MSDAKSKATAAALAAGQRDEASAPTATLVEERPRRAGALR